MSLISPKTIVITAYPGKHGSITMQPSQQEYSILGGGDSSDYDSDGGGSGGGGPRKRRRLTHLSPDEKMLRRKLKNRVAAQTARDRKKALMQDLEEKVAKLEDENKQLRKQNNSLKEASSSLAEENASLKSRLSAPVQVPVKTESEPIRSAAPAVPLQKERVQILSRWMAQYSTLVMILSLVATLACAKNLQQQTQESASSRKRKQPRPSRRILLEEVPVKQEVEAPSEPSAPPLVQWWGSHQQSWNPSTS